jgi:hypothetical protein
MSSDFGQPPEIPSVLKDNAWVQQLSAAKDEVSRLSEQLTGARRAVSMLHTELVVQRELAATLLSVLKAESARAGDDLASIRAESPKTQSGIDDQTQRLAVAQELCDGLARSVEISGPLVATLSQLDYADDHPAVRR